MLGTDRTDRIDEVISEASEAVTKLRILELVKDRGNGFSLLDGLTLAYLHGQKAAMQEAQQISERGFALLAQNLDEMARRPLKSVDTDDAA